MLSRKASFWFTLLPGFLLHALEGQHVWRNSSAGVSSSRFPATPQPTSSLNAHCAGTALLQMAARIDRQVSQAIKVPAASVEIDSWLNSRPSGEEGLPRVVSLISLARSTTSQASKTVGALFLRLVQRSEVAGMSILFLMFFAMVCVTFLCLRMVGPRDEYYEKTEKGGVKLSAATLQPQPSVHRPPPHARIHIPHLTLPQGSYHSLPSRHGLQQEDAVSRQYYLQQVENPGSAVHSSRSMAGGAGHFAQAPAPRFSVGSHSSVFSSPSVEECTQSHSMSQSLPAKSGMNSYPGPGSNFQSSGMENHFALTARVSGGASARTPSPFRGSSICHSPRGILLAGHSPRQDMATTGQSPRQLPSVFDTAGTPAIARTHEPPLESHRSFLHAAPQRLAPNTATGLTKTASQTGLKTGVRGLVQYYNTVATPRPEGGLGDQTSPR